MGHGLLLINLGTPNSPTVSGVRSYLCEFLTDKRVINLPAVMRYLLVYCFIAPFRSQSSAKAYQSIWTDNGSPLLQLSLSLTQSLQDRTNSKCRVALGMRYGSPSIKEALETLKDCETISILPLYPQYSSAATGSSLEEVMRLVAKYEVIPSIRLIRDFYQHPAYIKAQSDIIRKHYNGQDYLLFSYHGLPERQLIKAGCETVCIKDCPLPASKNPGCYKAQCQHTSLLLAQELQLSCDQYSSTFQSRLGKIPWIKPYTDEILKELAAKGIKNITIVCPSFVTDCLETLEEIGMRAKEQWQQLGGEQFTLVPSMNNDPGWVEALLEISNTHLN